MIDIVVGKGSVGRGGCSTWAGTAAAALPLYLTMIAASAGALVDTALLGNHTTAALAAFAVTLAVFSPATATVAGALRGVMPFVAPREDDPTGSCLWCTPGCGWRSWPAASARRPSRRCH
ncbi:hypothetical protein ABZ869_11740 [Streptomyces sp. NPDC046928]|uniref:hypothetical protein n=1 Tax=Streptomyces sp. NPDC046928 TaxID=3155021 RepID=UPI0033E589FF